LFIITLGAEAVGGVLSTVVVPVTVDDTVLVSAIATEPNNNTVKIVSIVVSFFIVPCNLVVNLQKITKSMCDLNSIVRYYL